MDVGVLACGWLGLPFAENLVKAGYRVYGSVTCESKIESLHRLGIIPSVLKVEHDQELELATNDSVFRSEVLVVNLPPERREDITTVYPGLMQRIISVAQKKGFVQKILFISSTSVYPNTNAVVDETCQKMPDKKSGIALLEAENLFKEHYDTTIIRFAGLVGADRVPGRFLAGKKDILNAEAPINLIHRNDCLQIMKLIIQKKIWGEVFNACSLIHPTRKEYYTHAALKLGLKSPHFLEENSSAHKIISCEKLLQHLGADFQFEYPDPMQII